VTYYRALARRVLGAATASASGHLLELGAGSGRVTIPLARDGHHVTAVDVAPAMLERLRGRVAALPAASRGRVAVVAGDLRDFTVPPARVPAGGFRLAIAAFNVLEHLYTRGEVNACLRRVAAHLAPDGLLAFDVQVPDLGWLSRDPGRRWARTRFTDPSTGQAVTYSTNHDYDPVGQIAMIRLYYDPVDPRRGPPARVVQLSQRKFFPAELEALVAHAGFRVVERHGDFAGGPLGPTSESQILLCRPIPNPPSTGPFVGVSTGPGTFFSPPPKKDAPARRTAAKPGAKPRRKQAR
jgi:SAM-dependent methyltransferase